MTAPLFSVLVPVYNTEKFLGHAVQSVLAQTCTDWELILVNDGSTDQSGKLCDAFAAQYPQQIRVFHQENKRQLYTRNFAVSQAHGRYYVFLDADDALTPNALQLLANTFEKYACDCVLYDFQRVTPQGDALDPSPAPRAPQVLDKHAFIRTVLLNHANNSLCKKAVRAGILKPQDYTGYYTIKNGEDLLQSLQILKNCQKAVYRTDVLYLYTQNPTSVVHTPSEKYIYDFVEVSQAVLSFLEQEHIFTPQDYQDFHTYYVHLFNERLKYISRMPIKWGEQKELFAALKNSVFYTRFMTDKKYKNPFSLLYTQFRLGLWRPLVWEVRLYTYLKNLRRKN